MATYFFTWELGQGLGHLVNLRPLAEGLSARGHDVHLVLRDLVRARSMFRGQRITFWQAPFKSRVTKTIAPTLSFAHLMYDAGFCDVDELAGLATAWRNIFAHVAPRVIVFDHSPSALVAARGLPAKRVLLGTGFFCPIDEQPLRCLQPWLQADMATVARDEAQVLERINQVLALWAQPPIDRVARLFHPHDENFLVTFAELDHYTGRTGARYWGAWGSGFGKPPVWPPGSGKRIYAYLKPFHDLPRLLHALKQSGCPTLIYADGISDAMKSGFASPALRFETEPLDMPRVAAECDLAVLNANHGTLVAILLAGKPSLQIPIYVEQSLLANAVMRMGAALGASPAGGQQIEDQLNRLLTDTRCAKAARQFAAQHAGYDPNRQIAEMLDRLEALARK
jgi:hypothetical protein